MSDGRTNLENGPPRRAFHDANGPINRQKTYDLVADRLTGLIASNALAPGDALPPERELAATYAVGRSSVREALRTLESQGVIAAAPTGAFVVAVPARPLTRSLRLVMSLGSEAGMHELIELRRIVECESAALAAERREPAHLQRMDAAIGEMAAALSDQQAERFIEADVEFHLALAEATGNRLVEYTMDAIRDILQSALLAIFTIPRSAEKAIDEHRAIRIAIGDRDPQRARDTMRGHLDRVEGDLP